MSTIDRRPPTISRPPGLIANEKAASEVKESAPAPGRSSYLPSFLHYTGPAIGQGAKPTSEAEHFLRNQLLSSYNIHLSEEDIAVAFLQGAAALAVFFCYPRITNINATNPSLSSASNSLVTTTSSGITITFNLTTDISITSASYIDYTVQHIDVVATPQMGNASTSIVGKGTYNDLTIAKMAVTTFVLPLSFSYAATSINDTDPTMRQILVDCGVLNSTTAKQPISIGYTASL
ncbi:hypothetical protein SmJEL517_g01476 [Synchytrium microbalum]|uniref:Uncharacterized protein n=1 Tax=Synchytrium microbalum TaxID=1806994 RepID=A0A507CF37_9FUNG|nr:uncharacterized protein SmJEL517_g01476 [Synchytrium microbalum]TPX36133.1 hypothetical protein SmJEL517_g01476 [Synchytrium microbalum]